MQHINLFNQIEQHVEPMLSSRQQLRILIAIGAVWLLGYLFLVFDNSTLQSQYDQLSAEQAQTANQLAAAKAEIQRQMNDPTLSKEVDSLKGQVAFRKKVIENIGSMDAQKTQGFAGHLKGLARQSVSGLWFTRIDLNEGGQAMALEGMARKPEYLPQYIQRLSDEVIFKGQQFRVFRLSTPEKSNGVLEFEIRANDEVTASR